MQTSELMCKAPWTVDQNLYKQINIDLHPELPHVFDEARVRHEDALETTLAFLDLPLPLAPLAALASRAWFQLIWGEVSIEIG